MAWDGLIREFVKSRRVMRTKFKEVYEAQKDGSNLLENTT